MKETPRVSSAERDPVLEDVVKIVCDPKAADILVARASELGEKLKNEELKMTQVRDIFDELRQIESFWMRNPNLALRRLHLLQPKLAYRAARTPALTPLKEVLEKAVQEVVKAETEAEQHERFKRLMEFAEAIVAYHKAFGGE